MPRCHSQEWQLTKGQYKRVARRPCSNGAPGEAAGRLEPLWMARLWKPSLLVVARSPWRFRCSSCRPSQAKTHRHVLRATNWPLEFDSRRFGKVDSGSLLHSWFRGPFCQASATRTSRTKPLCSRACNLYARDDNPGNNCTWTQVVGTGEAMGATTKLSPNKYLSRSQLKARKQLHETEHTISQRSLLTESDHLAHRHVILGTNNPPCVMQSTTDKNLCGECTATLRNVVRRLALGSAL